MPILAADGICQNTNNLAPKASRDPGGVGAILVYIWLCMLLFLWGFAFIPAPEKSPEWMLKTQAACFGTMSNGLPASQGWIILILSPLFILSILWASHPVELSATGAFIRRNNWVRIMFICLVPVLLIDAHWFGKRMTYAYRLEKLSSKSAEFANPLPENYLRLNKLAPSFSLTNHQGETITQEIFRGHVTILTFTFAHCATICPILIKDSLTAVRQVDSPDLQTVVISIDPWRDTPSSLPSLAKSWSLPARSQMLTGTPDIITDVLKDYAIVTARDEKTGDFNHASQIMMIDRNGRIAYSFLNPSVDWLVTASGRLLSE